MGVCGELRENFKDVRGKKSSPLNGRSPHFRGLRWMNGSQPVSRVLSHPSLQRGHCRRLSPQARPGLLPRASAIIYLGDTLPRRSSDLPDARGKRAASRPRHPFGCGASRLLGLAPGEGFLAIGIAADPGGLLHRRFTLTSRTRGAAGGHFLWPYPRVASPGSYPAPCYVGRGLSSVPPKGECDRPAN